MTKPTLAIKGSKPDLRRNDGQGPEWAVRDRDGRGKWLDCCTRHIATQRAVSGRSQRVHQGQLPQT